MAVAKKTKQKITDVSPEKSFWLCDGRVFKNLKELGAAMEKMTDGTWKYHVTKERNDFANWAENVFGDKKLGLEIRKAKNAKAASQKIKSKTNSAKLWTIF